MNYTDNLKRRNERYRGNRIRKSWKLESGLRKNDVSKTPKMKKKNKKAEFLACY